MAVFCPGGLGQGVAALRATAFGHFILSRRREDELASGVIGGIDEKGKRAAGGGRLFCEHLWFFVVFLWHETDCGLPSRARGRCFSSQAELRCFVPFFVFNFDINVGNRRCKTTLTTSGTCTCNVMLTSKRSMIGTVILAQQFFYIRVRLRLEL